MRRVFPSPPCMVFPGRWKKKGRTLEKEYPSRQASWLISLRKKKKKKKGEGRERGEGRRVLGG